MESKRHPAVEIERKFLVEGTQWQAGARKERMRQGYLARAREATVRVRITESEAILNIKGKAHGITRPEFEYPIPLGDAEALLELCGDALIEKTRHHLVYQGHTWEVDVFEGANAGLVVAEIELDAEDETFARPAWLGREVTHDPRYTNAMLCSEPYRADWLETESDPKS